MVEVQNHHLVESVDLYLVVVDGKSEQMMVEEVLDYNHKHCNQFVDFHIEHFLNSCNHHTIDRMEVVVRQLEVVEQLVENFVVILVHFLVTSHDVYDY